MTNTPVRLGTLEDLGEPLHQVLAHDQALGVGPKGEPQAYFVVGGNTAIPAAFTVVDINTGKTVFSRRLPRGDTSWAVVYSDHEQAVYGDAQASSLFYTAWHYAHFHFKIYVPTTNNAG